MKLNVSRNNEQFSAQESEFDLDSYSLETSYDRLKCLYGIVTNSPFVDSERSAEALLLETGMRVFRMEHALLVHSLSSQVGEVVGAPAGVEDFYVGQHLQLDGTALQKTISSQELVFSDKIANFGDSFSPIGDIPTGRFIATMVEPKTSESVALCFFSPSANEVAFNAEDFEFINLLAEGVGCMIDLQKMQAQRKLSDQALFANGSIKTLDEYLQQARLPVVYGVPARVVEVLERRIGQAPLSIGHIAEELNLSKRTLQRRLQQQDISFAELRDQVRFHHSIDYLVKQHQSIDAISASLDFSDRTSFTNAFKRWTGLSPSTFRKLFRDYV